MQKVNHLFITYSKEIIRQSHVSEIGCQGILKVRNSLLVLVSQCQTQPYPKKEWNRSIPRKCRNGTPYKSKIPLCITEITVLNGKITPTRLIQESATQVPHHMEKQKQITTKSFPFLFYILFPYFSKTTEYLHPPHLNAQYLSSPVNHRYSSLCTLKPIISTSLFPYAFMLFQLSNVSEL